MHSFDDLSAVLPSTTHSSEETMAVGRALARHLKAGDIVALYGNLGSGKTVLVRGICLGLGIKPDYVTSPTFTIIHEYLAGSIPVFHFDAYRIRHLNEFYELGYEEYFYGRGLCLVEWADRIEPLLPEDALRLHVEHAGGEVRRVIRMPGAKGSQAKLSEA